MSRDLWHSDSTDGVYTLARHWPPRFDFAVEAEFPPLRADRLAQQVRQDMWRALQRLRGFSPVIEVTQTEGGLRLRAGGRHMGPVPQKARDQLAELLADPARRARWARWAAVRG